MASSSSSEEQRPEQPQPSSPPPPPQAVATVKECVHKTKLVQFLGRTTPIVLQNDNGPCPLLSICNILLLRNNLNLSPDSTEVSQEKLLSLVAERLIDSNSNIDNKDEGYVENQQQNISDAIDLLPRLATGIDVNIKFRRIDDFEFTPECAIFDLLDIPLYHGWIVDPQDSETANAIGSKSYNTLMEELVALEAQNESKYENASEEDCVDFAAATTATLGVPSPCLSKARSFGDSPCFDSDHQNARKGDLEEEAELLRALKISQAEFPPSSGNTLVADVNDRPVSVSSDESMMKIMPVDSVDTLKKHTSENIFHRPDLSALDDYRSESNNLIYSDGIPGEEVNLLAKGNQGDNLDPPVYVESEKHASGIEVGEKSNVDMLGQIKSLISLSATKEDVSADEQHGTISGGSENFDYLCNSAVDDCETADKKNASDSTELPNADLNSDSSSGRMLSEALASSESEPLYEGEDCIMDPRTQDNEVREPVYEGEVVLANQADRSSLDSRSKDEGALQAGELIKNFLRSNASQLSINGLFCLQAGLKERELCVFFRNNHFSTMFKFNDDLYLLATDQGYINQPDLVWEKLNEVNGDTVYMTGNFKEFKIENQTNDTWNEQNALSSTAEFIASIDSAAQAGLDINPDLQLAIALQQQEFDQPPQRQNMQQQQPSVTGNSRLITGPQVPRNSGRNPPSSSLRPESKQKDKCTVM